MPLDIDSLLVEMVDLQTWLATGKSHWMRGRAYKIIWQAEALPVQTIRHLGKSFRLDEVVEGERGEHGAIAMYLCLDEQGCAAYTIELDLGRGVCRPVVHLGHQAAVCRHLCIALKQDVVLAHLVAQLPCGWAVDPIVVVVWADVVRFLVFAVVPLEAVGRNDGHVVRSKVLDEGRRRLDNVGIHPQDPRRGRAHGRKQQRIARLGHGCTAGLLVLHLVPLGLELALQRVLRVLAEDGHGGEAPSLGPRLCLGDLCLQRGVGGVALLRLRYYEGQRDEAVRVVQLGQVVPVLLVEARHGREDQDRLLVLDGRLRVGQVVHVVVDDRGSRVRSVRLGLAEGQRRRRQRVGRRLAAALANGGRIAAGEEEDEKAYAQDAGEDNGDGIRAPKRA
jgi:hypothetical protein